MHHRTLYTLTFLAAIMSFGHHVDHVLRSNHGWPLTDEVNAFTISLVIYPIIVGGLLLYRANRVGPGFWAFISGGGAAFVGAIHFGPGALEPPAMILGRYDPPVIGWIAFSWLVALVVLLAVTCIVEARTWYQQRRAATPRPA
jgi:hypothetical protein